MLYPYHLHKELLSVVGSVLNGTYIALCHGPLNVFPNNCFSHTQSCLHVAEQTQDVFSGYILSVFLLKVLVWEELVTQTIHCGSDSMKDSPMLSGGQSEYKICCDSQLRIYHVRRHL